MTKDGLPKELHISITGFKSIERVELVLRQGKPIVLIGPPASGKSNLLEALALYAYAVRAAVEAELLGVYPSPASVPPLDALVRMVKCSDMYRAGSTMPPIVEVSTTPDGSYTRVRSSCDETDTRVRLELEAGSRHEPSVAVKARVEAQVGASRQALPQLALSEMDEALGFLLALFTGLAASRKEREGPKVTWVEPPRWGDPARLLGGYPFLSPRLYGFDRLGAVRRIALGATGARHPSYLAEDASNIGWILYRDKDLLEEINGIVGGVSGIEVRPLASGALAFFDGVRDIGAVNASDTVVRLVYALAGLGTVEKPPYPMAAPLVMLEEPEAHTYPITRHGLVEKIRDALGASYVLVTTHSGRLAQLLWQKLDAEVLYVARKDGSTRLYRVRPELLLGNLEDLEDLVNAHGAEALKNYVESGILEPLNRSLDAEAEA